jgi:Lon-like protease
VVPRFALPSIERIPGGRAFASLSRRVRTLAIAGVLFLVLFILSITMPVPYVILSPGPTLNTLGTDSNGDTIIVIEGKKAVATTGHLNLTTVSISGDSITAFQALTGWLRHDEVVVPRTAIYPPGTSEKESSEQDTADFTESQDNAIAASSCELGYPKKFGIVGVQSTGAAHAALKPGDIVQTVDGQAADSQAKLVALLQTKTKGTTVNVGVQRAGKPIIVKVTLGPPVPGRKGGSLGISGGTVCAAPYSVDLGLGNQIGGPSAGLMFALGIMEKVGAVDLTGGKFIAGTGEITADGVVKPIGGIQLKMIAAKNKGASVFLAPAGNCGDVRKDTPSGLKVVKVNALHDAVQDLLKLQKNEPVPGC